MQKRKKTFYKRQQNKTHIQKRIEQRKHKVSLKRDIKKIDFFFTVQSGEDPNAGLGGKRTENEQIIWLLNNCKKTQEKSNKQEHEEDDTNRENAGIRE